MYLYCLQFYWHFLTSIATLYGCSAVLLLASRSGEPAMVSSVALSPVYYSSRCDLLPRLCVCVLGWHHNPGERQGGRHRPCSRVWRHQSGAGRSRTAATPRVRATRSFRRIIPGTFRVTLETFSLPVDQMLMDFICLASEFLFCYRPWYICMCVCVGIMKDELCHRVNASVCRKYNVLFSFRTFSMLSSWATLSSSVLCRGACCSPSDTPADRHLPRTPPGIPGFDPVGVSAQ